MARVIEVAVPAERTEELARRLADHPGMIGIEVQRGVSWLPAGDMVTFRTTNEASFDVLRVLEQTDVLDRGSFTIDEPVALVVAAKRDELATENNEAPWEEMESLLRRDTNLGFNFQPKDGGIPSRQLVATQDRRVPAYGSTLTGTPL